MNDEDECPICNYTGYCQTETGAETDLNMCISCGALMYYHEGFWIHHTVYDEIIREQNQPPN